MRQGIRFVGLLTVLLLVAAACGDDGNGDAGSAAAETQAEETAPTEAAEGDETGAASIDEIEPLDQPADLTLALSQSQVLTLPLWHAIEEGWFEQVGLSVQPEVYRGSSNEQIPRMATGEVDISLATPSPALFNQMNEGFGIQVIAGLGEEREGRISAGWLTVLTDLEGEIVEVEDLAGRTLEGTRPGSPPALLMGEALQQAGLTEDDVDLQYRVQAPPDMLALAEAGAADVIGMNEPFASLSVEQGLVVKWKSTAELMPWFQPGLLAASPTSLEENPEAVTKFLEVYLLASRTVNEAEGEWTDALRALVETALIETSPDDLAQQGGVPFFNPDAVVSIESLERVQETYIGDGELETEIDPSDLVAEEVLADAVANVGGS